MNYNQMFVSSKSLGLFYERLAVKKAANSIGFGIILFFVVSNVIAVLISTVFAIFNIELLQNEAFMCILNIVATLVSIFVSAFFILGRIGKKADDIIDFKLPTKDKFLPAVMVGIGFCYVANLVTALLQSTLEGIITFKNPSEPILPSGPYGFLLSILAMAVFPALLEEFLFRGVIMGSLTRFGKPFAIFISSLLFGLVHQNLVQIPFAFLVGLALSFVVMETGSIWTGVIVHFFNNFIATVLQYLTKQYNENLVNACYLIFLAAMIMLGFFGIYLLSKKDKKLFCYPKPLLEATSKDRFKWFCGSATVIIVFVFVGIEVALIQLVL